MDGITIGAEVNVNADWNAASGDAVIVNKPTTIAGYGIVDAVNTNGDQSISGIKTFSGTLIANNGINLGSKTITNVAEPINSADAATKNYTDLKYQILLACIVSQPGANLTSLKTNGLSVIDLKAAGAKAASLITAGFTLSELKAAGYTVAEFKADGFTLQELVLVPSITTSELAAEFTINAQTGTGIVDADANIYNWIGIGNQIWLKQNLKTTKFNNGIDIPNITVGSTWAALTTPAYCFYINSMANKDTYGVLYNWYAVNAGNLSPIGWHVPTDGEWTNLSDYLGGGSIAGGKLKEVGTVHWNSPNERADNSSGFTALPGAIRYQGAFNEIGRTGFWWSSSEFDTVNAWCRLIAYYNYRIDRFNNSKSYGLSVRCIRD